MIRAFSRIVFLALLTPAPAGAEPVFVTTGLAIGQGWVSKQGPDCIVVTARHVMDNSERGRVVTRGGVEGFIGRVARHPGIDIAILWITGGELAEHCPSSTLGFDDSRPELDEMRSSGTALLMQISSGVDEEPGRRTSNQVGSVPVLVRTIDPRSDLPTFTFVAARADIPLRAGDSGAAIVTPRTDGASSGEPVGIVIEEGAINLAVRFDLAKSFFSQLTRSSPHPPTTQRLSLPVSLTHWQGILADQGCGPLQAIESGDCRMMARPAPGRRSVILEIRLDSNAALSAVEVNYGGSAFSPFSVSIAGVGDEWTQVRYCRPNGIIAQCSLGGLSSRRIRLSFEGPIDVQSIRIY